MELREGQRTQSGMVYSAELNHLDLRTNRRQTLQQGGSDSVVTHSEEERETLLYIYQELFSAEYSRFFVLLLLCIFVLVLSKYISSLNCLVIVHKLFSNNKCSPESP